MAEKKSGGSAPRAPAKTTTRAKSTAKASTATRAAKAPAKAPVIAARPVAKRTVARKRTAPTAVTPGVVEQWTWRRLRRKTKVGVVVSAKMAKTIIVEVGRQREHPLYKKVIRLRKRFATHDEAVRTTAGGMVPNQESRPFNPSRRRGLPVVHSTIRPGAAPRPPDTAP